jgi:maleylacetate reductase
MIEAFEYEGAPSRIVFGAGGLARAGEMVDALGRRSALVLSTRGHASVANALAEDLGKRAAGVFAGAVQHTPVDVTAAAVDAFDAAGADCTIALGGGSTIGLGKAIALHRHTPQIAVPTTYSGSEATPVLGQTDQGEKTTARETRLLPDIVLYDPDLTLGLPPALTAASGLNAMAHAIEGLYARNRNPVSTLMAIEGVRAFARALPAVVSSPTDTAARTDALYGSWLCGTVLGSVSMALHHKLCHVLGGAFDLPHAQTHAVILPHAVAFNESATPLLLRPIADAMCADSAGVGLHGFAKMIGAPISLRELGLAAPDLDRTADLAVRDPYWNPRPITRAGIRKLLEAAWAGDAPYS